MEKIKITGQVYHVGEVEQVSEKFRKREFVIKTADQYPQFVLIQVVNDRCELLDSLRLNDNVDAFINIRGREWTDRNGARKFFNTLEAWQVTFASISNRPEVQAPPIPQQPAPIQQQPQQQTNYDPLGLTRNPNDLPF
jgi:Protein of unknown function (DUF3127).